MVKMVLIQQNESLYIEHLLPQSQTFTFRIQV
nr:MAG TPA: hypothetical protein [Caudoviricetes sp.]